VDHPRTSAPDVRAPGLTQRRTTTETESPVQSPADSETSPRRDRPRCPWCKDTGFIRWTQPVPQDDGTFAMHDMEHPCTQGCGGWWKQPAAESRRVVEVIDSDPITP
jgi:hypothetical protein